MKLFKLKCLMVLNQSRMKRLKFMTSVLHNLMEDNQLLRKRKKKRLRLQHIRKWLEICPSKSSVK
jgi:hypothetical protein